MGLFKKLFGNATENVKEALEQKKNELQESINKKRDEIEQSVASRMNSLTTKADSARKNREGSSYSDKNVNSKENSKSKKTNNKAKTDKKVGEKSNDEYRKMLKWRNEKTSELDNAAKHKNDSQEDKERYEKLSKEYEAITNALRDGAKSITEIKAAVKHSIGVEIDLSEPDIPQTTKKEKQAENEKESPMFSARLESLIKSAFQDGVLTQKEKEIIMRRAEKEGEDPDEFEMLLNERIEEMGIKVIEDNSEESPQKLELATSDSNTPPTPPKEKGRFSEKLLFLIDNALEDGVLTDQEKNAIIKRAQAEGEDIDEVDIYIQSLQHKRQKELQEQAQESAAKEMEARRKAQEAKAKADQEEEKERATLLRICPACGCQIPHLSNVCPDCGHIINTTEQDKEIMELIKVFYKSREHPEGRYIEMKMYDNDPIMKKAYSIDHVAFGKEYYINSNYYSIRSTLETLYGDHPKVRKVLKDSNLHEYNELVRKINSWITSAKNDRTRSELGFNNDIRLAKESFAKLSQFKDVEGWEETYNKLKVEIDNLSFDGIEAVKSTIKGLFKF